MSINHQTDEIGDGQTFELPPPTPDHLLTTLAETQQEITKLEELAGRIEMAIIQDLRKNGNTEMVTPDFKAMLKTRWPKAGKYDPTKLIPLKEMFDEDEMKHVWELGYEKITTIMPRFNTIKMEAVIKKRGGPKGERRDVLAIAENEGAQYIDLERRQ